MIAVPALESLAPLSAQRVLLPRHSKYTITEEGVFTVVQRKTPLPLNNAVYARLFRWARAYSRWTTLLVRFMRMVVHVNPGRFAIYWVGRLLSTGMDSVALWSDTRLEDLIEQAVSEQAVQQTSLLKYAIANIFSNGLRTHIEGLFTTNEGAYSAAFDTAIRKRLIHARAKLDIVTLANPIVCSAFGQANSLEGIDVASHVVSVFTSILAMWSQVSLYRSMARCRRTISYTPILAFTFASSLTQYLRWFILSPKTERSRSTHYAYQRLNELWSLSCLAEDTSSNADIKLLNLQDYLSNQFDLADHKLGNSPFMRNCAKPPLQFALEVLAHAWPVMVRSMFALQAMRNPARAGSLSRLSVTIMCARKIAFSISDVLSALDEIRLDCSKIKAFYEVMEVRSQITDPVMPERYATMTGPLGRGMKIEFRNVSFDYDGGNGPMALKNVSFCISPGALVCIVGGNGAGKVHSELLERITVQLQYVPAPHLTIAEFVGLGAAAQRPGKQVDAAAVKYAFGKADAMQLIDRLDKGIWTRLGPSPPRPTARTVLDDAIWFDEQVDDEWATTSSSISTCHSAAALASQADLTALKTNQTTTNGPHKRNTFWGVSFSGGEWAKICFARSLMKDADFRIFDEPAAALDALAQRAIFQNIDDLRGKQSIVHVTHHIRSAVQADLILCLKNGELVEQGTHYDLISQARGFYRSLAEVQMPEAVCLASSPLTPPRLSGICTPSDTESDTSNDSGFFAVQK